MTSLERLPSGDGGSPFFGSPLDGAAAGPASDSPLATAFQPVVRLGCVELEVFDCAFNPRDEQMVAFASNDGLARVYRIAADPVCVCTIRHTDRNTKCVEFAPDGSLLAVGGASKASKSADGSAGGYEGLLALYDVRDGWRKRLTLDAENNSIFDCCFSPCGRFVAYGGYHVALKVFMIRASDGELLADAKLVLMMRAAEGARGGSPRARTSVITSAPFSPCGHYLAFSTRSGGLRVMRTRAHGEWDERAVDETFRIDEDEEIPYHACRFSHVPTTAEVACEFVANGYTLGSVVLRRPETGEIACVIQCGAPVHGLAFSPHHDVLLVVATDVGVSLFHAASSAEACRFADADRPFCCAISRSGDRLAYGTSRAGGRRLTARSLRFDGCERMVRPKHNGEDALATVAVTKPVSDDVAMAQTWRKHRRVLARPDSSDALGSVRVPEAPAIDGAQESIREIRKSRKISANMSSSFFGNHDANAFLNVSDTPEAPARLRLPRVEFSHRGSLVVQDVRVSRTLGKGVFADPDEEQAHSAEGGTDVKWDDAFACASISSNGQRLVGITTGGIVVLGSVGAGCEMLPLCALEPDEAGDAPISKGDLIAITGGGELVAFTQQRGRVLVVLDARSGASWEYAEADGVDGVIDALHFSDDDRFLGINMNSRKLHVFEHPPPPSALEAGSKCAAEAARLPSPILNRRVRDSTHHSSCFAFVPRCAREGACSQVMVPRGGRLLVYNLARGADDDVPTCHGNVHSTVLKITMHASRAGTLVACATSGGALHVVSFEEHSVLFSLTPLGEGVDPRCLHIYADREVSADDDDAADDDTSLAWRVLFGATSESARASCVASQSRTAWRCKLEDRWLDASH